MPEKQTSGLPLTKLNIWGLRHECNGCHCALIQYVVDGCVLATVRVLTVVMRQQQLDWQCCCWVATDAVVVLVCHTAAIMSAAILMPESSFLFRPSGCCYSSQGFKSHAVNNVHRGHCVMASGILQTLEILLSVCLANSTWSKQSRIVKSLYKQDRLIQPTVISTSNLF